MFYVTFYEELFFGVHTTTCLNWHVFPRQHIAHDAWTTQQTVKCKLALVLYERHLVSTCMSLTISRGGAIEEDVWNRAKWSAWNVLCFVLQLCFFTFQSKIFFRLRTHDTFHRDFQLLADGLQLHLLPRCASSHIFSKQSTCGVTLPAVWRSC